MNLVDIKEFVNRENLTGADRALQVRILELDQSINAKRIQLNDMLTQASSLQKQINSKDTEIFADSQRLSELCDLVIQIHSKQEVV